MKRYLLIALVIFTYLALTSCATNRNPYPKSDYSEERWMSEVETNPDRWSAGADTWFLTGNPNSTEEANRHAPFSAAVTTMMIKVTDFSKIKIGGDFQVQIFGTDGPSSVYVYGPNDGVRAVSVSENEDMLWLRQTGPSAAIKEVIVRIGVNQLSSIEHLGGCGSIEGIRLRSSGLEIISQGPASGNMYLAGNLNTRLITNVGTGRINVFGAKSHDLVIKTSGGGSVNVAGSVTPTLITHNGRNDINIVGANGALPLRIYTSGAGKISINGRVNIKEIRASDTAAVFAYPIMSRVMEVSASGDARIGLSGNVMDLNVDTSNYARFWGRYLCAQNAYVHARNHSHMNIAASNKFFASAIQSASIYFFGSPDLITPFATGDGVVIPIWPTVRSCAPIQPRPPLVARPDYKGELLRAQPIYRSEVRREVRQEAVVIDAPSPRSTKTNPYVWKNKRLVENKSYPGN